MTSLREGVRVPKESLRIEVNGCLDELNALLGIVRTLLPADGEEDTLLKAVQRELMVVMSHVATPPGVINPNPLPADEWTARWERQMDTLTESLPEGQYFLLSGGTPVAAHLHLCRTVARRAERRLWTLHRQSPLPEALLGYVNRLSDLFFVLARAELCRQEWPEERWQAFAYKRKSR